MKRSVQSRIKLEEADRIDRICDRFERDCLAGQQPEISDYLGDEREPVRTELRRELEQLALDYQQGSHTKSALEESASKPLPASIDRYEIVRELGSGGFGRVLLAQDTSLDRLVAIKIPHAQSLLREDKWRAAFLAEARHAARLDHPHIVPVYDFGQTDDGECFIVSKFIEGQSLAERLSSGRPSTSECVTLVAAVADGLQHAHENGLVHRDIKPSNILLGTNSHAWVADFGVALNLEQVSRAQRIAGTPAYMSPEQARGEGHRVDGRSDIFSLGTVLYEMLTGKLPFRADGELELLELIATADVQPPRQHRTSIPRQLEEICLRALSRRAVDRFNTALDLADELRMVGESLSDSQLISGHTAGSAPVPADRPPAAAPTTSSAELPPSSDGVAIMPRGLRSYGETDAGFFTKLLPGPHGPDGLPNSIRFWKQRIEARDPEATFGVGLMYGPSGCGKSSLVRAGILPHLAANVIPVMVDATPDHTERQLLAAILRARGVSSRTLGASGTAANSAPLTETMRRIRLGKALPEGHKLLLVIDQFEQWLHAHPSAADGPLITALRHCDGTHLQCLLLVRDDFWMAVTRFLYELEVNQVPDRNVSTVDLFDLRHARKVLTALGRAYDALPEEPSKQNREFVRAAVASLAENDRVISVRLALFAEMVKSKPWVPSTLKQSGGTEGIGVLFLEDTFQGAAANPEHRFHEAAARRVLKLLLPDEGTDIRGSHRSQAELLTASGYQSRPKYFADLLRILDTDLRLLTPVDREDSGAESGGKPASPGDPRPHYQLTHDFLVPALRSWLTRRQRETAQGRAELLLEERAALWTAKPDTRHLPSLFESVRIGWHSERAKWTSAQSAMMRQATRRHMLASALLMGAISLIGLAVFQGYHHLRARSLVETLVAAETADCWELAQRVSDRFLWTESQLRRVVEDSEPASKPRLHAALALLSHDASMADFLLDRLVQADAAATMVICQALSGHEVKVRNRIWPVLHAPPDRRTVLRAAAALSTADPDSPRWPEVAGIVANELVSVNPSELHYWIPALRPTGRALVPALTELHASPQDLARASAATALADYLADEPKRLAELIIGDARDRQQYSALFTALAQHSEEAIRLMRAELAESAPSGAENELARWAQRRVNAAVALFDLGQVDEVRPLLEPSSDQTVRSYLIHRFAQLGAAPQPLVDWLIGEPSPAVRRALILSLGEYRRFSLSREPQTRLLAYLTAQHAADTDPGIHSAIDWFAQQWNLSTLQATGARPAETSGPEATAGWYVSPFGQTMVRVPAAEYLMGHGPKRHRVKVGEFFISATEVSNDQYQLAGIHEDHWVTTLERESGYPAASVSLYRAMRYCNELSRREGLPAEELCYQENDADEFADGMRLVADYAERRGYRLPTEEEWEFACRTWTVTRWHFGEVQKLSPFYAWCVDNSGTVAQPVGQLKPNDFGLFDMHGNLREWCQPAAKQQAGPLIISDANQYPTRGGAFYNVASANRFQHRSTHAPSYANRDIGFRVVRRLP